MTSILVPLADGVEEMEAVIVIDMLRRAGWDVIVTAIGDAPVITASRGVKIQADLLWQEARSQIDQADGIVIAGGGNGVKALCQHDGVLSCLQRFKRENRLIGAICAGPLVLQAAGILKGHRYTCYPGVENEINEAQHSTDKTVRDERLITSQGPGTAFDFALTLLEEADGAATAATIRKQIVLVA